MESKTSPQGSVRYSRRSHSFSLSSDRVPAGGVFLSSEEVKERGAVFLMSFAVSE